MVDLRVRLSEGLVPLPATIPPCPVDPSAVFDDYGLPSGALKVPPPPEASPPGGVPRP